jgi:hypothetical protein
MACCPHEMLLRRYIALVDDCHCPFDFAAWAARWGNWSPEDVAELNRVAALAIDTIEEKRPCVPQNT